MAVHNSLNFTQAEDLGNRLRELREARGLTQERLANAAGINRNHYQLLEDGRSSSRTEERPSNPTLATLLRICGVLQVPISAVIVDVFDPVPGVPVEFDAEPNLIEPGADPGSELVTSPAAGLLE